MQDGRLAAEALLKACKGSRFIDKRAFQAYLGQPVTELSTDSTGRIETITTSKYRCGKHTLSQAQSEWLSL